MTILLGGEFCQTPVLIIFYWPLLLVLSLLDVIGGEDIKHYQLLFVIFITWFLACLVGCDHSALCMSKKLIGWECISGCIEWALYYHTILGLVRRYPSSFGSTLSLWWIGSRVAYVDTGTFSPVWLWHHLSTIVNFSRIRIWGTSVAGQTNGWQFYVTGEWVRTHHLPVGRY